MGYRYVSQLSVEQGGNLAWYVAQMPEPGTPRPLTAVEGEPALAQTLGRP
jgi:hypothetical protein